MFDSLHCITSSQIPTHKNQSLLRRNDELNSSLNTYTLALITAKITHGDYGITLSDVTGNQMQIDIPVEQGGGGKGMRPMQTLLAALIGCSVVDIVSILKKQKQHFTSLNVEVDGERAEGKEPSLWQKINLSFFFTGDIDLGKAQRAVDLSITKYCSVAETLRRAGAIIEYQVFIK